MRNLERMRKGKRALRASKVTITKRSRRWREESGGVVRRERRWWVYERRREENEDVRTEGT